MLVDDTYLWPAKVCVPALAPRIDIAIVTIQVFETCPVTKATMDFYRPLVNLLSEYPRPDIWNNKKATQRPVFDVLSLLGDRDKGIAIGVLTPDFKKSTDNTANDGNFLQVDEN
ncbi:uncharacterized protein MCYG_06767 [Microsporum canis CBS 113480]|uniref:Uncharacterized protein n=1 Tax=Arthroderma otae (strain ATCC MYA-4605 / CBS 113480) TaxID=554155 RepID=C5FVL4_ARTOC|nr:uncharacterized protein MCYG_06767 [Microsporum canis CBS 113480]EEQ33948.1 predicted protein [Microsporum canis CBS 113480]